MFCRLILLVFLFPIMVLAEVKRESEAERESGQEEGSTSNPATGPITNVSPSSTTGSSPKSSSEVKVTPNEFEESLSGTVKVMRKNGMTEVFFSDLKESYFIPSGSKNYGIFKALTESQKRGSKVSFKVNKKSRQVLDIEASTPTPASDAKKSGSN